MEIKVNRFMGGFKIRGYSIKCFKNALPSLRINSDFDPADTFRNKAAEFGRYVSNVAESSINGLIIPCYKRFRMRKFNSILIRGFSVKDAEISASK